MATQGSRRAQVKGFGPVSRVVAVNATAWVAVNLLVGTLTPPAQAYVWRGPLQTRIEARRVQQPHDPPNLLTTTLAPAAPVTMPFSLDDWPNPVRRVAPRQDWSNTTDLTLLGKDQFFGAPGQPPPNRDWPNPRGPARAVSLLTWIGLPQPVAAAAAQKPFSLIDWPVPPGPRAARITLEPVNLQNTLLQPAVTYAPFRQPFFTRIVARLGPPLSDPPNLLATTLRVTIAAPFSQKEWPNPTLRIAPRQDFQNAVELALLGQDRVYGAPGQVPTYDWPNPRAAARSVALFSWIGLPQITAPAVQAPFALRDWPNPTRAILGRQDWQRGVTLALLGQDVLFGGPGQSKTYDWPVPAGPRRAVDLLSWIGATSIALSSTPQAVPFALTDWPVPRGPLAAVELRTWLQPIALNLLGRDTVFGAPGQTRTYDWPVPPGPGRAVELLTWAPPVSLGILVAPPAPLPFNQADWPNPRGPLAGIELRTWVQTVALNLIGRDAFFGGPGQPPANLDWPVPRGAFRPDLTWVQSLAAILTAPPPPKAFALLDWPNPAGPRAAMELRTWIQPVALNLLGRDNLPPFRSDQSVPRGPARSIELLTWLQSLNQATAGPAPFALRDWPNPRGPVPAIILRTWTQAVALNLLGRDNLLIRQTDWPVVRRVPFLHPELRPSSGTWFHLFDLIPVVPARIFIVPSLQAAFLAEPMVADFLLNAQRDFEAPPVAVDFVLLSRETDFIAPPPEEEIG